MRVDGRELPLSTIPLSAASMSSLASQAHAFHQTKSKAVLTAPLERSTCLYQWSLLSFRMRSRSSMPSRASSSLDLVVTLSCSLTLQICLIIALSFRCRCWRFGFVNGQVLTGMEHCAPLTRAVHVATCLEREVAGRENW